MDNVQEWMGNMHREMQTLTEYHKKKTARNQKHSDRNKECL